MGYAGSWLAVKEKYAALVLEGLGLRATDELALPGETHFTGMTPSNGWFILLINECQHKFVRADVLTSLSIHCELLLASAEEHVMWCAAEFWQDGSQIWRIEHDAQKGNSHLSTSGLLPDGYPEIAKEFTEKQKESGGEESDIDYIFEIPLQVAKSIVGFKHDEAESEDGDCRTFKIDRSLLLADPIAGKRERPWWKFW